MAKCVADDSSCMRVSTRQTQVFSSILLNCYKWITDYKSLSICFLICRRKEWKGIVNSRKLLTSEFSSVFEMVSCPRFPIVFNVPTSRHFCTWSRFIKFRMMSCFKQPSSDRLIYWIAILCPCKHSYLNVYFKQLCILTFLKIRTGCRLQNY